MSAEVDLLHMRIERHVKNDSQRSAIDDTGKHGPRKVDWSGKMRSTVQIVELDINLCPPLKEHAQMLK